MRKQLILFVLLLMGGMQAVLAQKTITGKVVQDDGSGIPGVTVVVSGTSVGTTTDISGNYSLKVPADAKALKFSYIGMKTIEIEIGPKKVIDVPLEADVTSLDEVVVVGYGTQKKRDLTGAIASVKSSDILVSSNADIGHALKGKAAGLMIRENSAQPGGGLDILIRGAGSQLASNAPLIVVDGFPITELQLPESSEIRYVPGTQSVLNTFNPNDIESIEVLKDASATAIYGSRLLTGLFSSLPREVRKADRLCSIQLRMHTRNIRIPSIYCH
jgi:outer membrane receptor protein involved in Fe transport